jgi:hypothetical protein
MVFDVVKGVGLRKRQPDIAGKLLEKVSEAAYISIKPMNY